MENVLKTATWGIGAEIARSLSISPQAWANKIKARPLDFIKGILLRLKSFGELRRAQMVTEDITAFIRLEIEETAAGKSLTLCEIVGELQKVLYLEVECRNRYAILDAWRSLIILARVRMREISAGLESEESFDYGTTRQSLSILRPSTGQYRMKAVK